MRSEKRIPTLLGLILLFGTIFLTTKLVNSPQNTLTKASQSCEPINPQITNITEKSVSISFTTSDDCFTSTNVDGLSYENSKAKSKIHYFDINKLEASKNYQFDIISDGKKYSSNNFIFETATKPTSTIPVSNLAWGKVFTPDNNPATNAIVYLNIPGASPLSASVTSSGHWNISLAVSFNEGLSDWFFMPENVEEDIVVIAPDYPSTQIVSNTSRNNPVPDIILGQNNFSIPEAITPPETPAKSLINTPVNLINDRSLDILNPKTGESINSIRPDFFGTGLPNSLIKIKVESPVTIDDEIQVGPNGEWNWSPDQGLTPGEHTITVTDDRNNIITRKFVVLAAESLQPAFSASESGQVATSTPTPKPTKTLSSTPTPTPTKIVPTKKITPTQIPATNPSTASGIPKTGAVFPTFIALFLSLIFISFGFIYYKRF